MKTREAAFGIAALISIGALAGACQQGQTERLKKEQTSALSSLDSKDLSTSRHAITWSQERLMELDAAVSAVEADSAALEAVTRIKAERRLTDLRAAREAYRAAAAVASAHTGTWTDAQAADAQHSFDESWNAFDTSLDAYLEETEATLATRRAVIEARGRARQETWRKAIEDLRAHAQSLSAEERGKAEARIVALEAQEKDAHERVSRVQDASDESWQTAKQDSADALRLFTDTYLSIRQSFQSVEHAEKDQ